MHGDVGLRVWPSWRRQRQRGLPSLSDASLVWPATLLTHSSQYGATTPLFVSQEGRLVPTRSHEQLGVYRGDVQRCRGQVGSDVRACASSCCLPTLASAPSHFAGFLAASLPLHFDLSAAGWWCDTPALQTVGPRCRRRCAPACWTRPCRCRCRWSCARCGSALVSACPLKLLYMWPGTAPLQGSLAWWACRPPWRVLWALQTALPWLCGSCHRRRRPAA